MGGRVILHDSPAGGGVDGGVRRGFREKLLGGMHFYEYRSVRYWSKEIDETLTGGRKIIFLIRGCRRDCGPGRMLQWNPVHSWSREIPGAA